MGSLLHSTRGWRRRLATTHRSTEAARVDGGRCAATRGRHAGARPNGRDEIERAQLTERARFVRHVDIELQVACRAEAADRHELGIVTRALLRNHAYRRLGFVRLSDYARERLGVSARTLQAAAWVATRLDALPIVAAAFDRSELSWTRARAVCAVAGRDDQEEWLARARTCTVDELERVARALRRNGAAGADPDDDDGTIDGEPATRLRIACPARVRGLWRRALALAACVAGEALAAWRAAEIIAAEALSGRPEGVSLADRAVLACMRLAHRREDIDECCTKPPDVAVAPAPTVSAYDPPAPSATDPFALDARLVAIMRTIRTSEPRIGRLLRIVVDQRVYRAFGFTAFADYARERLGISARKAWALLKVERSTRRGDEFARAYDAGTISWVCALTLLPVVDRQNAGAWVARAHAVTVRRLADEVNFVLEARDLVGPHMPLDPPPLDSVLVSPPTIAQIRAHPALETLLTKFDTHRRAASEVCDVEVQFTAPASVVALVRDSLDAFAEPGAPRWSALERVLQHVIAYWEALPQHHDPIFARDGWRCAVPGCSSRRNLHDHHLHYRSRGGGNERENRVAVCAAHHQHGIHVSVIRAWGTAPRDVHWELGLRSTGPPLLAYVGDRRYADESANGDAARATRGGS